MERREELHKSQTPELRKQLELLRKSPENTSGLQSVPILLPSEQKELKACMRDFSVPSGPELTELYAPAPCLGVYDIVWRTAPQA